MLKMLDLGAILFVKDFWAPENFSSNFRAPYIKIQKVIKFLKKHKNIFEIWEDLFL